jgi:hypothetical protein
MPGGGSQVVMLLQATSAPHPQPMKALPVALWDKSSCRLL